MRKRLRNYDVIKNLCLSLRIIKAVYLLTGSFVFNFRQKQKRSL